MIGWLSLALLIVVGFGALWLLGVRGAMLQACAAALLFGAAGYALQGSPGVPGAPAGGSSGRDGPGIAREAAQGGRGGER